MKYMLMRQPGKDKGHVTLITSFDSQDKKQVKNQVKGFYSELGIDYNREIKSFTRDKEHEGERWFFCDPSLARGFGEVKPYQEHGYMDEECYLDCEVAVQPVQN